mmetsp:Transcript_26793/g.39686  ORF Transcript_26793/g.39686 Transcript_26793/m.39686 type:complete len:516 (+) Transcript_26793:107-1654(+)
MPIANRIAILSLLYTLTATNDVNVSAFTPTILARGRNRATGVVPAAAAAAAPLKHQWFRFAAESDNDYIEEDEDDDEDDEEDISLYEQTASSEFSSGSSSSSSITPSFPKPTDWGGEHDLLRSRLTDTQSGNNGPSRALFRSMTSESPNEAIMNFVSGASPEVVTAMSSAVQSLLGGLGYSAGGTGIEVIVKANGERLGNLCFQLQMTGYMFRNAEYVLAIRDLMNIQGSATMDDYKRAFDKLDNDNSGYIESKEIEALLKDVYNEDELPAFEVETFLQFFDSNRDGRISWEEFEKGLGVVADKTVAKKKNDNWKALSASATSEEMGVDDDENDWDEDEEDDDDEDVVLAEPTVSGMIQIEMKNGKVIEVEAKEYMKELKKEAAALKAALSREQGFDQEQEQQQPLQTQSTGIDPSPPSMGDARGIAAYISSLDGDIQSLTKGISQEVVEAMQMLVEFVLDGGPAGQGKKKVPNQKQLEMEIPGSALQQLALWQLVLGYKLRENEATGEYRKMLE